MTRASRRAEASAAVGAREDGGDGGFTLVELLVAISIFAVLTAAVFSGLTSTAKTVEDVRSITNLTAEARVAIERLTRELRQSSKIYDAHLPAPGTNDYTSVTFGVDFNGVGGLEENAVDPEIVTYRYEPMTRQLTLTANDVGGSEMTRPILAANVTDFQLSFTSSLWAHDTNGDGVTTWREIDHSVGNDDGIFNSGEFDKIDSVGIMIQLLEGSRTQTYTTQVDLRNQNQN